MKYTIEVDNFYLDEEELTNALKDHIKHTVIQEINTSIHNQVAKATTELMIEFGKTYIEKQCTQVVDRFIKRGIVPKVPDTRKRRSVGDAGTALSFEKHFQDMFLNNNGFNRPSDTFKRIAERCTTELKERYDKIYAMHIVESLGKQGMLNEELASMMLAGSNKTE
jgi:hypothetical protein